MTGSAALRRGAAAETAEVGKAVRALRAGLPPEQIMISLATFCALDISGWWLDGEDPS